MLNLLARCGSALGGDLHRYQLICKITYRRPDKMQYKKGEIVKLKVYSGIYFNEITYLAIFCEIIRHIFNVISFLYNIFTALLRSHL